MPNDIPSTPIAIVGIGAIMPDAPDADRFWQNIRDGRYSISDVPPERWDPDLYYSADHDEPDKTYSRIGGWVREYPWDPIAWKLPVPPKVADQMDDGQRWAISAARAALVDAGWPNWNVNSDDVAVILGNAIGGEKQYRTNLRIELPEVLRELETSPSFASLDAGQRDRIVQETRTQFLARCNDVNEDTMPGELANVMAGRIANLFNFHGPNFTTDAACASGLAALSAAVEGLVDHRFDAAVTGGVDRNMGVAAFVKFCKIGALSATGTRPFDAGADGFVMGEGAALFVLKRLEDAERDGDRVYAVILGVAGSSDGKGKGITAPNPVGQRLAVERAWDIAGLDPATVSAIEAHGTSTRVGDATELASLTEVFGAAGAARHTVALGSVKSNIGHLKAAAGTAGLFKMARSLHDKVLAPSLNFRDPNPNVDWDAAPFAVTGELRAWEPPASGIRRGGVSAFGFGGTNFHVVMEEHVPGRYRPKARVFAGAAVAEGADAPSTPAAEAWVRGSGEQPGKPPLRGALALGGSSDADVLAQARAALADAVAGHAPAPARPDAAFGRAAVRLVVDFADAADLAKKLEKAITAIESANSAMFRMLRQQGVFLGRGPAPEVAFLYTGQGSQYVNMLQELREREPIVADTFREADTIMTPLLGRPLTSYIFVDGADAAAVQQLEQELLQTEITQPAVLATDASMHRMLAAYGMHPDMVMGHSLGEYGALVAAGSLTFGAALEAVSARGREMAHLSMDDNGAMAAVFGPLSDIERIVASIDGYVVIANINSNSQAVVGGATVAVERATEAFVAAGMQAVRIPVSHAFHTSIVAPASVPLVATLERLDVRPPRIPVVANVTGAFYPADADQATMLDVLGRQVASPVQFVRGLHTLYDAGARVFVEVGPKRALHGFVEDVLGAHDDVVAVYTNHPKQGDVVAFNQALCALWAAGVGFEQPAVVTAPVAAAPVVAGPVAAPTPAAGPVDDRIMQLGRLFAGVIEEGLRIYGSEPEAPARPTVPAAVAAAATAPTARANGDPVVITGAALGLPGVERVFDDENIARILAGQQFIGSVPADVRQRMVDMHVTRLVKGDGGARFDVIDDPAEVIKLAGRRAPFDIVAEFAVDAARDEALDSTTRLAIGAGFDALRDAGIPLAMRYKTTTLGTQLPDRWGLPDELRDDTGVIFASAFPGYERFAADIEAYAADRARREHLLALEGVRVGMADDSPARAEVDRLIAELRAELAAHPYAFDRRFLFRILSMGHSQFAEIIGARGPNTQVNAACASTTQALSLAEDWIRAGRCRRVVVIAADDVTSESLMPWIATGFLATGAAATDEHVEDAATPFDRRRHGMIVGMGAAALVVESADAARERGLQPICEVLASVTANSAFHGTRLDVEHIGAVMESLVQQAEARGVDRHAIAASTMFVSHETYTPARGGSAAAEINALRRVFGSDADRVVITNTKGFTGHAMGAGIEDVVAVKALETGLVPPVPNYLEPDPDLGALNLSRGGAHDVRFALRLAAGFGSQIAMALLRWTPVADGQRRAPGALGYGYRVVDGAAWQRWLDRLAGRDGAQVEVDHRRLRIADVGAPATSNHESHVPVPYAGQFAAAAATQAAAVVAAPPVAPRPEPAVAAPPAASAAPAVRAPEPEPEPVVVVDDVLGAVTSIVAGMTGYPVELLDPDLDLEADLGVDTVKQAEVFAAVREHYGVERDERLQLRDFPTLRHVAAWVRGKAGLPEPAPSVAAAGSPAVVAEPVVAEPVVVDDVLGAVTSIVAGMTGYPVELLDPDLDLEADLGVDTVKQAEVFAAVREHYGVERDERLQLRDFPTLRHVAAWVRGKAGLPDPAPATAAPAPEPPAPSVAPSSADPVLDVVTSIVGEMTGYPVELLDPDLDLEADLGVDTVKQAEVFAAVREHYAVERDERLQLRDFPTLRHVAEWVRSKTGAPAPAPEPEPEVAPVASSSSADPVLDVVTSIVGEMTGYPVELLDPDLDLEADLGVDTVKQAEVFAAVREHYAVERDERLQLRDFPTLRHVAEWVRSKADVPAAPGTATAAADSPVATSAPARQLVRGDLDAVDALPRRIPTLSVRPAASRCLPTGVELAGARVVVMLDEGGVGEALVKRLDQAGATPLVLEPGVDTADLLDRLGEWRDDGPIAGVFWLPALDADGDLAAYDLATWREALRRRVKSLYATMRRLHDDSPFLVAATRLGGAHGYDDAGATNPLGGAVTGFAKSYAKERPDAIVKAVDLAASRKTAAIADQLVEELLFDPGAVEIGRHGDRRVGVAFVERPFAARTDDAAAPGGMALDGSSVFVVTGAAGSIVSAITADLALASGGTFHLLDLTPEPDRDDLDLVTFRSDRDALKSSIADRMRAAGDKPTPVAIERELARFERLDAALSAIEAIEAAGGTAHYHSVDLTDADGVDAVMAAVRDTSGRVDVLLHAAGLEISRNLPDKEPREYDLVFDVKSDGWFNLVHAAADMPIAATVVFSSVAGRFGNQGQTDYSAANDLLCKYTSHLRRLRPETRAIALDWTAWGGIGMATRGSIPKIMEMAGVQMLPPEAGVAWIRRELTAGDFSGEVVVAGELGMMAAERHANGGVDPLALAAEPHGPMLGTVELSVHRGVVVRTTLDPTAQPFLDDHRIDGTPVLPGVMGMEAFAEAASLLVPDLGVVSVEDVRFEAPFKFFRDEPRELVVEAVVEPIGDGAVARCRLLGERVLPGGDRPQVTVHFTATVVLGREVPEPETVDVGAAEGPVIGPDRVYELYFHGPAYRVVASAWRSGETAVTEMTDGLPPNHLPDGAPLTTAPRLAELCFQTAGLWEAGREGRLALPMAVGRVTFHTGGSLEGVRAVARPTAAGTFDCAVVNGDGTVLARLDGYRTVPLPTPIAESVAGALHAVFGGRP